MNEVSHFMRSLDAMAIKIHMLEERLNEISSRDSSIERKKKLVRLEESLEARNKKIEQLKNHIKMLEAALSEKQSLEVDLHNSIAQVRKVSEENTRLKKNNDFLTSELVRCKEKSEVERTIYNKATKGNLCL